MAYVVLSLPDRRLAQAYQALFQGTGSAEDARMVLADIEAFSGYFQVTTADTPDAERSFSEGMRAVFGRIHTYRGLTDAAFDAVERSRRQQEEPLE